MAGAFPIRSAQNGACKMAESIKAILESAFSPVLFEGTRAEANAACDMERHAELVAIGARIRDVRNLNYRIKFLTAIAEKITFLRVLENERITLRLVDGTRFVSTPREIPDEIREWIVTYRAEIVRELREREKSLAEAK